MSVDRRLAEFAALPVGWHYGSGGPIPPAAIERARDAIALFAEHGFPKAEVFPSVDREVLVAGYRAERREPLECVEVICGADGFADFYHEVGDEEIACHEGALPREVLVAALAETSKRSAA